MLEQYEEKLLLFKKFKERKELLTKMRELVADSAQKEEAEALIESLEKLD